MSHFDNTKDTDNMPWATDPDVMDKMLRAARVRSWELDTWWLDEAALGRWWDAQAPLTASTPLIVHSVPSGSGYVAWIARLTPTIWGLEAISPETGERSMDPGEEPRWWKDGWLTVHSASKELRTGSLTPLQPGERIAGAKGKGATYIAKVHRVDHNGKLIEIVANKSGTVMPAEVFSDKWFHVEFRDEAFDFFWNAGETRFTNYGAFKLKLWNKQKKLTGEKPRSRMKEAAAASRAADKIAPPLPAPAELDFDPME